MNLGTNALRDYSDTELMALPANSRLLFAENLQDGLLTYQTEQHSSSGILRIPALRRRVLKSIPQLQLRHALSKVKALRCMSHGLSSFSLYPTTQQQYLVNRFLWASANSYSFSARDAATLFQRNVFIISMPASLFDYLTSVTWEQVEYALLFVLVSLARDENSTRVLKSELPAELANKFDTMDNLAMKVNLDAFKLFSDKVLDHIIWTGPWLISTGLCFLSASDMSELLDKRYQRAIFSTPEKFELVHTMMWNIYRDWQTYRELLVAYGQMSRLDALELMAKTISRSGQEHMQATVKELLELCVGGTALDRGDFPFALDEDKTCLQRKRKRSHFGKLPFNVLMFEIVPKVCKGVAERKYARRSRGEHARREAGVNDVSLKQWLISNTELLGFYGGPEDVDSEVEDIDGVTVSDEELIHLDSVEGDVVEEEGSEVTIEDDITEASEEVVTEVVGDVEECLEQTRVDNDWIAESGEIFTVDEVHFASIEEISEDVMQDEDVSEVVNAGSDVSVVDVVNLDMEEDIHRMSLGSGRSQRRRLDEDGTFVEVIRSDE